MSDQTLTWLSAPLTGTGTADSATQEVQLGASGTLLKVAVLAAAAGMPTSVTVHVYHGTVRTALTLITDTALFLTLGEGSVPQGSSGVFDASYAPEQVGAGPVTLSLEVTAGAGAWSYLVRVWAFGD